MTAPNPTLSSPSVVDTADRNFDDIADHFAKKVYGGLKGEIRLAVLRKDLFNEITKKSAHLGRPLRILDIGAGLAQISLELASEGHQLTINDISENMLAKAKNSSSRISEQTVTKDDGKEDDDKDIEWITCPYQQLNDKLVGKYDVILCHALLEWLETPKSLIDFAKQWLVAEGLLSLCFYNPASFVYRNLIMGNFNLLNNPDFKSDNKKSLTPNNPVDKEAVFAWLHEAEFQVKKASGLRVFHDYSPLKRGGHNNPEDVLKMEVRYSDQEPYKWMGRYLHVLAVNHLAVNQCS